MNTLDLISDSPRLYIFQKGSNKTNLGGILTIVYFIILILIFMAYLYNYLNGDDYQYSYFYKSINLEKRERLKKENENYNPEINIQFEIRDKDNKIPEEKFSFLLNSPKFLFIKGTEFSVTANVDKFELFILYDNNADNNNNNNNNNNDKDKDNEFNLNIYYESKILDHENKTSPVKNSIISINQKFFISNTYILEAYWGIYNYEEEKGIFSKIFDSIIDSVNEYKFSIIDDIKTYQHLDKDNYVFVDNIFIFKLFK